MRNAILETLKGLIRIPSVNPGYADGEAEEHLGEERAARYAAGFLEDAGIDAVIEEVEPGRPNVYCEVPGSGDGPRILLEAHLDTVGVRGMTVEPFEPVEKGGRLYGRGACDDKGAVAVFLHLMKAIVRNPPRCTVCFCGVVGEEHGGAGAYYLADSGRSFDAAIIGEPTRLRVSNSHKGVIRCRLVAEGKSAHGSTPVKGVNAIYIMRPVLEALEKKAIQYDLRAGRDAVRHVRTLNVGMIRGGTGVNIVPDHCELEFELRYLPEEDPEKVRGSIGKWVHAAALDPSAFTLDFLADRPGLLTDRDADIVKPFVERTGRAMRISYHTDGGIYWRKGIPCVVFGPGNAAQAHTEHEYIEIDQLGKAYDILLEILREY